MDKMQTMRAALSAMPVETAEISGQPVAARALSVREYRAALAEAEASAGALTATDVMIALAVEDDSGTRLFGGADEVVTLPARTYRDLAALVVRAQGLESVEDAEKNSVATPTGGSSTA